MEWCRGRVNGGKRDATEACAPSTSDSRECGPVLPLLAASVTSTHDSSIVASYDRERTAADIAWHADSAGNNGEASTLARSSFGAGPSGGSSPSLAPPSLYSMQGMSQRGGGEGKTGPGWGWEPGGKQSMRWPSSCSLISEGMGDGSTTGSESQRVKSV